jgi:hypothetical protein
MSMIYMPRCKRFERYSKPSFENYGIKNNNRINSPNLRDFRHGRTAREVHLSNTVGLDLCPTTHNQVFFAKNLIATKADRQNDVRDIREQK